MAVTYKDIDTLSQKSTVTGTEKIPISDTQYITPEQIATSKQVHLTDEEDMPASPDANTLYLIDDDGSGSSSYETTSNKVTSLSSSSTNTQYPSAKCVYDLIGDVETLLAAL